MGKLAVETGLLLTCDFERKVQPTLSELEWLLCPFSRPQHAQRAVVAVVLKGGASLLTVPPARLRANFQFLEDQGLSEAQARAVLREAPQARGWVVGGPRSVAVRVRSGVARLVFAVPVAARAANAARAHTVAGGHSYGMPLLLCLHAASSVNGRPSGIGVSCGVSSSS